MGRADSVFRQNDGKVTTAYYIEMNAKGLLGQLSVALFRAQKRSIAAKTYRGRRFTRAAYEVKNWSISEIVRILCLMDKTHDVSSLTWGWGYDAKAIHFEHVLYVTLPTGQISFHSDERLEGPDYPGEWDGQKMSRERILTFCDSIDDDTPAHYIQGVDTRQPCKPRELFEQGAIA